MREMRSTRRETKEPNTAQKSVGALALNPVSTNNTSTLLQEGNKKIYQKKEGQVKPQKEIRIERRGRPRKNQRPTEKKMECTDPVKDLGKTSREEGKDPGKRRSSRLTDDQKTEKEEGTNSVEVSDRADEEEGTELGRRRSSRLVDDQKSLEQREAKTPLRTIDKNELKKGDKEKCDQGQLSKEKHIASNMEGVPVSIFLDQPTKTSVLPKTKVTLLPEEVQNEGLCFEWDPKLFYTVGFKDASESLCSIKPSEYKVTYQIWAANDKTGEMEIINEGSTNKPWKKHHFFFSVANFLRPGAYELHFVAEPSDERRPPMEKIFYTVNVQDLSASARHRRSRSVSASDKRSEKENTDNKKATSSRKRPKPDSSSQKHQKEDGPLQGPPNKKSKEEPTGKKSEPEPKEEPPCPFSVAVDIPDKLVQQLLVDWENITKKKLLVPVPRSPTVRQIIQKFQKTRKSLDSMSKDILDKVILCFNGLLGHILLYRFEREQYEVALSKNENTCPADLYGAEHLLRLMVCLPRLIGEVGPEKLVKPLSKGDRRTTRQLLHPQIPDPIVYRRHMEALLNELTGYLQDEKSLIFTQPYTSPEQKYSVEIPT